MGSRPFIVFIEEAESTAPNCIAHHTPVPHLPLPMWVRGRLRNRPFARLAFVAQSECERANPLVHGLWHGASGPRKEGCFHQYHANSPAEREQAVLALGQKMLEFLLARSERDGERAFAYLGQQRELRPSNAIGEFTLCGCVPIIFYYTKIRQT